jgi:hypothetical protein
MLLLAALDKGHQFRNGAGKLAVTNSLPPILLPRLFLENNTKRHEVM